MSIKQGIVLFFGLLSMFDAFAQSDINYQHRSLVRLLRKANVTDMSVLKEILIPDSLQKAEHISGKYLLVNNDKVSQYQYIYVGRVNSCRAGGCSNSNNLPKNETSEYFDYFILFDKNKTVQKVKVFNYQATHGYEITAKGWLKQFKGHDASEQLQVNKNIDAISGATISVYAITSDVENKTNVLKKLLRMRE